MEIVKKSIKDQVYEILRSKILSGEMKLGEKLNIAAISSELHVSNTPVREALSMLEKDGLVEMSHNTGPSVIGYSPVLFQKIEKAVAILILGAYDYLLASGKTDELCSRLADALERQEEAAPSGDIQVHTRQSMEFDDCFVELAENDYLDKLYREISDLFFIVAVYDQSEGAGERQNITDEHRMILQAIQAGDYSAARDLIARHYSRM